MPDTLRRRLLTAMATSPLWLNLSASAAVPPDLQRIIAIEWLPVELLLALGIAPMAVADKQDYQVWVGKPELAADTIDVGLRTEPNLELMTQLQPSLIVYSSGYGPSPDKIARIAPGMGFSFNEGDGKPLTAARHSLVKLAQRLDIEPRAHQHLAEFDSFIAQMRARLAPRVQKPLLLMSLIDNRHAIVFGKSSLFLEVMNHLGIENAWQEETSFWGSAVIGLERLAVIKDADVICFSHGDEPLMQQVSSTALWQSFAFIRQQRFKRVPAVWFYGATLTAMQFCYTLDSALEA
ncbi:Fe(3+)-hydroxamate ABC transporter substrate-binding protein FhuD [Erwiniaceae bacterium BAC15a-03b]|uniref:Fe(3+)-hydroxamate ABC transporter substrate-binding protein FhuD n=1 Tax=Winslowiella arboricola TaxID=2978220 RepID=A0A9J6PKK8_9GAMM|nr:Fe(3+)-hydroxamate ABC transporter substrate-binding protein FhuD [Winslowiella arboricola]MCU5771560.1 Fe(3+)-hydroxamate ABC transporter substrate-binding protein FhuD [Winslowiella arboricola]MCU5776309.1 Fe(3+)-hydroxamate ABC transporter substrate-binding protein FhuD [Winslowiella arboricola]